MGRILWAVSGLLFFVLLTILALERPVLRVTVKKPSEGLRLRAIWEGIELPRELLPFQTPRTLELQARAKGAVCLGPLSKLSTKDHSIRLPVGEQQGTWSERPCAAFRCLCTVGEEPHALRWKFYEDGELKLPVLVGPDFGKLQVEWDGKTRELDLSSSEEKMSFPHFSLFSGEVTYSNLLPLWFEKASLEVDEGEAELQTIEIRLFGQMLIRATYQDAKLPGQWPISLPELPFREIMLEIFHALQAEPWFLAGALTFLLLGLFFERSFRRAKGDFDRTLATLSFLGWCTVFSVFFALHLYSIGSWDSFNYAELSRGLLNGGTMYRDIWQDKPILAPLAYLPAALFRMPWGMNLEFAAILGLITLLIARSLRALQYSPFVATFSSGAYFLLAFFVFPEGNVLGLEHLSNLILLLVITIQLRFPENRKVWFFCGLIAASLVFLRQNNVFLVVALGIPLLKRGRRAGIPFFVLGGICGALGIILLALPFMDPSLFWFILLEYPRAYAQVSSSGTTVSLPEIAVSFLSQLLPVLPLLGLLPLSKLLRRENKSPQLPTLPYLGFAFAMAFLVILAPQKLYAHYGVYWLPIIVFFLARSLAPFAEGLGRLERGGRLAVISALFLFYAAFHSQFSSDPRVLQEQKSYSQMREIQSLIEPHISPGDTIYVFGGHSNGVNQNSIYLASGLSPAHPISNYCELNGDFHKVLPDRFRHFWEDIGAKKPRILIYGFTHYEKWCEVEEAERQRIRDFFRTHYRPLGNVSGFIIGVREE